MCTLSILTLKADLAYECTTDPNYLPHYYNINVVNLRGANTAQAGIEFRTFLISSLGSFDCPSGAPCQVNMYHVDVVSVKNFDCNNVVGETENVRPIPCY